MTDVRRPLPRPDEDSEEFWRGCRSHELRMQRCDDCGHIRFRPSPVCPACLSEAFSWERLSGRGVVHSFGVVRRPLVRGFEDLPYVLALVDLDEGPRLTTQIVGCEAAEVAIGMPVEARFDDVTSEITLAMFAPVGGRTGEQEEEPN